MKYLLLLAIPLLAQAFQGQQMNSLVSFLSRRFSSTLSMTLTNESTSSQAFHTPAVSRRDVVKTVVAGSIVAAALGSGVSPALAEDIAQQMKALEKEFKDSVNSNGAPEKHLPTISLSPVPGNPGLRMVEVVVPHVMDAEKPHFIQAIWLKEEKTGDVAVAKILPATEPSPPSLKCGVPKGVKLTPYLYCNLHGLWKGETFIA